MMAPPVNSGLHHQCQISVFEKPMSIMNGVNSFMAKASPTLKSSTTASKRQRLRCCAKQLLQRRHDGLAHGERGVCGIAARGEPRADGEAAMIRPGWRKRSRQPRSHSSATVAAYPGCSGQPRLVMPLR